MSPPQEPIHIDSASYSSSVEPHSKDGDFKLSDLVQSIHHVLGDEGLDSERIDAQKIIQLMEKYSSNSVDWNQYTLFDHSRAYTRNLIDDGNGKFNLMILAWSKGQKSPIHDHSGSHCVMKILDGELQETLFNWPASDQHLNGKPLAISKNTVYQPNQVTYVHDNIGLHRISNPSTERGAVSLHLYTPPYQMCKTFEENTGKARSSGVCSFYSINGQRIQK
ncbi:cysteine dioxygenase [Mucor circinelloides 1006PhL]|uniref:Cysteine dioxygenase n=1 Tax=Mucor circinelloides f. circinelloides (strain 1006PhL) TaxID=1220926 RepID=S2JZX6_MUCC1|nr:cysteine dioxygenase [Mucor circinelloides 1006PhL]